MGENFQKNLDLVSKLEEIAARQGCRALQLAQGEDIAPIPGAKRRAYLEENLGALEVRLSPEELAAIDQALPQGRAAGSRYALPKDIEVLL